MWTAISRRFFMGKDTEIRPIRVDSRELLMECASVSGLNLEKAGRVIDGEIITEKEVYDEVDKVHAAGIHSIPVLVFEVEGLASGHWISNPNAKFRKVHHGSGNNGSESFKALLKQLHSSCQPQQ